MYWYSNVGMVWMFVFWVAIIVAVAFALRYGLGGRREHPVAGDSPEDILKKRYARGEIDRDEYQSRLADVRR